MASLGEALPTADEPVGTAESGQTAEVFLSGELDMSSIDATRECIESALASSPTVLICDLSELQFMDSSGIALLIQTANRVTTLWLRNAPPLIRRVLEATGVTEILRVVR
jgi:anti-anti-sigma factor